MFFKFFICKKSYIYSIDYIFKFCFIYFIISSY